VQSFFFTSICLYKLCSSFAICLHSVWVGGDAVAVVKSTTKQMELLARLMRAEAEAEGGLGMLMV